MTKKLVRRLEVCPASGLANVVLDEKEDTRIVGKDEKIHTCCFYPTVIGIDYPEIELSKNHVKTFCNGKYEDCPYYGLRPKDRRRNEKINVKLIQLDY